jgi:hypothetical protein
MAKYINKLPSLEELKKLFKYDPETGEFTKLVTTGNSKAGLSSGHLASDGYLILCFKRKRFLAHRLAWLMYYGTEPKQVIDHIDGNRLNNKIQNLRDVSNSENLINNKRNRNGGLRNTHYCNSRKKWVARICFQDRDVTIGRYNTEEEAFKNVLLFEEKNNIKR